MSRHNGGIVRPKDNPRDFVPEKVSYELFVAFIAIKINFVISTCIVVQTFRRNFRLGPATKDHFVYSHARIIILIKPNVEKYETAV